MRILAAILLILALVGCCTKPTSLKGVVLPPPPINRLQALLDEKPDPELQEMVQAIAEDRLDAQAKERLLREILLKLGAENPKK